ncbi:MAG: hypothetical protein ABIG95_02470 [Candidatus Woesearchaeota archaeon]
MLKPYSINNPQAGIVPFPVKVYDLSSVPGQPVNRETPEFSFPPEALYLSRGLIGEVIAVGTAPVLIANPSITTPYLVLNPARDSLLATSITGLTSTTAAAAGNSEATYIDVAGYETAHFFIDITANAGTWDIALESYDNLSGNWAAVGNLLAGVAVTGTFYAGGTNVGIGSRIAFTWNPVIAGAITFSIGVTLKNGLGGSSAGVERVVYLGAASVTSVSGYPLLEGCREAFVLGAGVALWGVANTTVEIRRFQL